MKREIYYATKLYTRALKEDCPSSWRGTRLQKRWHSLQRKSNRGLLIHRSIPWEFGVRWLLSRLSICSNAYYNYRKHWKAYYLLKNPESWHRSGISTITIMGVMATGAWRFTRHSGDIITVPQRYINIWIPSSVCDSIVRSKKRVMNMWNRTKYLK